MKTLTLTLSLAALLLVSVTPADASPTLLRPGTRAMWVSPGFGPAAELDKVSTQFKLTQTIGYHFSGEASGPALALDLQESFGKEVVLLEVGPRFVWDIQLIDGLGLYLSPSVMAGFAHLTGSGSGGNVSGFTLQLAVEGKLVLADRGLIFFRPVSVDVMGLQADGSLHVGARWDLLLGGGVIF